MPAKEKKIENIETIKKAIEVEIKHRYIDIAGRKSAFSRFIYDEIYNISRIDHDNPKWKNLCNVFERYPQDSVSNRMKAVKQLIKYLQDPFASEKKPAKKFAEPSKNPEDVDVMYVKGVGPKVAALLNKVGIFTAYDLLHYYPRKHLDYAARTPISELKAGQDVTIFGTIRNVSAFVSKKRSNLTVINITVADETGSVNASWFYGKSNKYMLDRYKAQFPKNANVILCGTVKLDSFSGKFIIDKPQITVVSGDFEEESGNLLHLARIVPVYPLTENLNIKVLRRAIHNAIETYAGGLKEFLPDKIRENLKLIDKHTAIHQIHFPDTDEMLEKARRRLIFEELFIIQLKLALMRKQNKTAQESLLLQVKAGGYVDSFVKSLPFKLTQAQNNAFNEILSDISSNEPMQRLLQGDVGSGKTVVACMTLLAAVENGYQGALMAPTEILAEQHYKNFTEWLTPLGISVGLFVGRHGVKVRREALQNLKNGQINIAIGTHALIQDGVEFNGLGAVVVDEQHRFGVRQRSELKNKGLNPEMLTMTATPIPRTLALTVHGDLDLTIIDELPKGRKPVKTALITARERKKAYDLIKKEIEKGHQAYIVFPLIDESESLSAKAATKEAEKLQEKIFPELKTGLVHGKLSPNEKDRVMEDFRAGKYNILVSTTVIEVGVDVPNATVMLIENAERFGLSQLHQLRGRVGRSDIQSYCVLLTESSSQETRERLSILAQTNNGFVISEKDLQLRGPGEFMGTRQSGLPDLLLADIVRDADILEIARDTAFDFVKNDDISKYPALCALMSEKIEEGLELIGAG
jgi:ATP-dependent DNA helicase RecG